MSMTSHPSFEDLSAYHDGEAPEWAAHVGGCAECRAQLDQLAALSAAVARPLAEPVEEAAATTTDPVARALATAGEETEAGAGPRRTSPLPVAPAAPAHPQRVRWLAWVSAASAAAVLVLVVGVLAVVNRSSGERTTGSALRESDRAAPTSAGAADQGLDLAPEQAVPAPASGPPTATAGGDLGEVNDAATLASRVPPGLGGAREVAAAPRVVGTYPCEAQARAADAGLGPVVFSATARVQGTPAAVLGFAPPGQPAPVTVQARAQSDCRLLLSATSP